MDAADEAAADGDVSRLVHELEVHQVELEMQNDELRRVQLETVNLRDRYLQLFNGAPVGYLTVDGQSTIREANRVAALLLDCPESRLSGTPLSKYVHEDDAIEFHQLVRRALKRESLESSVFRFCVADGIRHVRLVALTVQRDGTMLGIALMDITPLIEVQQRLTRRESQLRDALERLVTAHDDERHRIARELHDDAGQMLASLSVSLERLKATADLDAAHAMAATLQSHVEELTARVGRLARGMHPQHLEHHGIEAALKQHAAEQAKHHGLAVDVAVVSVGPDLPKRVARTVFRFVQEALSNVIKHAEASHVSIVVQQSGDTLRATAEDDGCGLDTEQKSPGLGLTFMRERAQHLGGRLEVQSSLGVGTTITLVIPLQGST